MLVNLNAITDTKVKNPLVSGIGRTAEEFAAPVAAAAHGLQDYLPPVLIKIARAFMPQVLKQYLSKIRHRSRVE